MFEQYKVKQLKSLISSFNGEHKIKNYSRMKKQELVDYLNNKYTIIDGKLQVKPIEKPKLIKNNKIKETFISTAPMAPPAFEGHKYLEKATRDIERKANIGKEKLFASRIRGNL